ncbi:MAG TPA: S8 family serine peptidase [Anaerolineales bacterium]|nr:S8 family serine peptidase [Anaerolineales bacterium]
MNRLLLRLVILLTLLTMLLSLVAPVTSAGAQESNDFLPDEVLVKLLQASEVVGLAADYDLDPTPLDQFGSRPIYRLRILDGASPPDRAAQLASDSRVVYAEPNFVGRAPEGVQRVSWPKGDESGDYVEQWAAGMIRLPEAHTLTRGAGITVAVLDTGVDLSHPALAGRLVDGFDFVDLDADPSEVGSAEQNLHYGHGTHVAGLIALVAPEARIMPLRVLDEDGSGDIWVLAEALAYAINPDGNLNTPDGADVINLSLSTTHETRLLAEIVASVTCEQDDDPGEDDDCLVSPDQHGAVVVAAAGNNGSSIPEYPAAEGVIGLLSVAASTQTDTLAAFSNYGSWVHVAAPGEGILSSVPGGGYAVWSGTSMATPLVAGEAALIRAVNSSFSAADVVGHIISKSESINGPVPKRVDLAAALNIPMMGEYRCTSTVHWITADNLVVPPGETCNLVGARIMGTLKVEEGATLSASGLYVKGSIQAKKAASVTISDSTIEGSLQVEEGGSAQLEASHIGSGALFVKNTGGLSIWNNTINGNLQCKENSLMPTGGGNIIQGNKEEQCSGL